MRRESRVESMGKVINEYNILAGHLKGKNHFGDIEAN
jgi:hypothetical protein